MCGVWVREVVRMKSNEMQSALAGLLAANNSNGRLSSNAKEIIDLVIDGVGV